MAVFALLGAGCADMIGVSDWEPNSTSSGVGGTGGGTATATSSSVGSSAGGGSAYAAVVLADGPKAYWRLGERADLPEVADLAGGFTGTIEGMPTLGAPGALQGDDDTAIAISADQEYILIGDALDFPMAAHFSVEAWVKPSGVDAKFRRIVDKAQTGTTRDGYVLLLNDARVVFERWKGSGPDHVQSVDPLVVGEFSHIVGTYDGKDMVLYVNGAQVGTTASMLDLANNMNELRLGADAEGFNNLDGVLDEVAIYDEALSARQVVAHFAAAH